MASSATVKR
ncbi:hypothetical protein LINPERHAP2_LOCUS9689 [Linum perenne]